MKRFGEKLLVAIALGAILTTACTQTNDDQRRGGQNAADEQEAVGTSFARLSDSQQVPSFDWSQERQTLIDVETIRATGATSTAAGYLEGIGLIWWCPSIGGPVPSSYQLSGSTQWVDLPNDKTRERFQVDQGEPTGVYIGDSAATWTLCLDDDGNKFAQYWEGPVLSTIGIVDSYPAETRLSISDLTFEFTEGPE